MGGEMDWLSVLVADVAVCQPAVEGSPVGGAADRQGSGQVRLRPGEQHRGAVRPLEADAVVLGADHGAELVVDGHEGLAFHLGVAVAQVRGAGGVGDDAVPGQRDGAGDPQPAADQYHGDQPVGGVAPAAEVRGVLDLGHHMGGDRPGKPLAELGVVLVIEDRGGGQGAVVPVVPAGVPEESVQR
jgi:hypothetical protein